MTVVFVVMWEFPHEGQEIRSVWSTEEAAQAEAARLNASIPSHRSDADSYFVEPFTIDEAEHDW